MGNSFLRDVDIVLCSTGYRCTCTASYCGSLSTFLTTTMVSLTERLIRQINDATAALEGTSLSKFHPAQMKRLRKLLTKVKDGLMEQTVDDMAAERLDDWVRTVFVRFFASCRLRRQLSSFMFQSRLAGLERLLRSGYLPAWSQMTDTQRELARIEVECCMAMFCFSIYFRRLTPPCFTSDSPPV